MLTSREADCQEGGGADRRQFPNDWFHPYRFLFDKENGRCPKSNRLDNLSTRLSTPLSTQKNLRRCIVVRSLQGQFRFLARLQAFLLSRRKRCGTHASAFRGAKSKHDPGVYQVCPPKNPLLQKCRRGYFLRGSGTATKSPWPCRMFARREACPTAEPCSQCRFINRIHHHQPSFKITTARQQPAGRNYVGKCVSSRG